MYRIAMLIVLGSGCTFASSNPKLTTAYVTTSAMVACDSIGTMYASHGGKWEINSEDNPMLGTRPSAAVLVTAGVVAQIANYVVYRAGLPRWFKAAWFGGVAGAETVVLARNSRATGACGLFAPRNTSTTCDYVDSSGDCVRDHR